MGKQDTTQKKLIVVLKFLKIKLKITINIIKNKKHTKNRKTPLKEDKELRENVCKKQT